ncbi:MAG: hypothetical protein ACYDDP_05810 [Acidithiobacillus sp.]
MEMDMDMEREFEFVGLIYQLEEAGYCFADVTDEQLQQAFSDSQDLRDLAVLRAA